MDITAAEDLEGTRRQLLLFAEDLQTIVARERERREEAELAYRELSSSYLGMVRTLAEVCEAKDTYTRSHLDRTYQYALMLTRRIAPELAERAEIGFGYLLHDIGKVGIPEAILNKPGPLTDEEWQVMRTHPVIGVTLVKPLRLLGDAVGIIRSHHERWDGKGYPEGLAGEDIYLPARIFMIADCFDAMTTDRPYRKALPLHVALEEIDRHAGTQFDPDCARAWVALCDEVSSDGASSFQLPR
ncbi:HD-GYP domain-containing protein [Nitriliruptor alkaliphilus]|uniref:HD-GYP domain-containing protein n=1 Tax=Nitriliruptor alkaliphilus TaxID=427918 RepID=UPI0006964C08|nr:HD-GYP domain-containing protein [Nitriliruptor alkaliphilus]